MSENLLRFRERSHFPNAGFFCRKIITPTYFLLTIIGYKLFPMAWSATSWTQHRNNKAALSKHATKPHDTTSPLPKKDQASLQADLTGTEQTDGAMLAWIYDRDHIEQIHHHRKEKSIAKLMFCDWDDHQSLYHRILCYRLRLLQKDLATLYFSR